VVGGIGSACLKWAWDKPMGIRIGLLSSFQDDSPNSKIVLKMISEFLVGGLNPSEKYEFVSWDYYIFPTYGKNEKCSKPPTRFYTVEKSDTSDHASSEKAV
jgi:hypothetical protein